MHMKSLSITRATGSLLAIFADSGAYALGVGLPGIRTEEDKFFLVFGDVVDIV